ncbi:putative TIM-barrel fold metal-dependent hydrolase [Mycobacteroides abscessus subsp. abscessus]|nr:putative TIM-barrel fold metal-dependent hydrolase [Mycobacteroides abscessus subsp. abscessus]
MRGGHNVVLNHLGLELAGITEDMPDPAGGHIGRDGDGRLNGWLQDNAATPVFGLPEEPTIEDRLEGFRAASLDYAAKGVGLVRDCFVPIGDLDVIQRALHDRRAARSDGAVAIPGRPVAECVGLEVRLRRWHRGGVHPRALRV